jgi:protein-tyrosine phosphatase
MTHHERRLEWDGSYNIRDLGGLETSDGSVLQRGVLVRADNLGHLTPAGQQALLDYGIRTIIDVRSAEECETWPHAFTRHTAISAVNIPIGTGADAEAQAALDAAPDLAAWGCAALHHCSAHIAQLVEHVALAAPSGVLIHCHAGKDRTGLAVALLLGLAGVSPDVIAADYTASNIGLQPLYAEWLAAVAHDPVQHAALVPQLGAHPETMLAVLAHLDAHYGGVWEYLRQCGVAEQVLAAVHNRLRGAAVSPSGVSPLVPPIVSS